MRSFRSFTPGSTLAVALAVTLGATGCGDDTGGGTGGAAAGGAGGQAGDAGQGGDPGPSTSVASTAAAATTVASSAATSGGGPIECPGGDYATFPQSPACDMLQQDCEPGFTCERYRTGGETVTRCVPRGGLKGIASDCEVDKECESGLFCIFNVCTPVCCPENNEPCGGGNCNLNLSYSETDAVVVCTYSKQCEPLEADACPVGSGCHFEEPTASTCIQNSGEDVAEGETCEALNDCGDMQQCVSECRWICGLEDEGSEPGLGGCPAGQSCRTSAAVGIPGIGICDPD